VLLDAELVTRASTRALDGAAIASPPSTREKSRSSRPAGRPARR